MRVVTATLLVLSAASAGDLLCRPRQGRSTPVARRYSSKRRRQRVHCRANGELSDSTPVGFLRKPVLILPGFLSGASPYEELRRKLISRGHRCEILDVNALEWAQTFWGSPFNFYLDKLDQTAKQLAESTGERVQLVGHSAGGWLARIWMGDQIYNNRKYGGAGITSCLISLGTPHYSLERYPFGRVPESREGESVGLDARAKGSSLWFANSRYPGDFHPHIRYVSVCGRSVLGRRWELGVSGEEAVAFSSYEANCGDGNVWGDGISDLGSACLEGSQHVILDGCLHSPTEKERWYGSSKYVQNWTKFLD